MSIATIDEVSIPTSVHASDAGDFVELMELSNLVLAHAYGSTDMSYSPAQALPTYQDHEFQPKRLFAARVDGRIV